ncbi:hypothetical protein BH11PSE3_BH11PSE3_37350 [soil metagenome]
MNRIWPDGKTTKDELVQRLDRAESLLRQHRATQKPLRAMCANHLADALGCLTKCKLDFADRALDAADKAAAETLPESDRRPRTYALRDLESLIGDQKASLPADAGHPKDGWPQ